MICPILPEVCCGARCAMNGDTSRYPESSKVLRLEVISGSSTLKLVRKSRSVPGAMSLSTYSTSDSSIKPGTEINERYVAVSAIDKSFRGNLSFDCQRSRTRREKGGKQWPLFSGPSCTPIRRARLKAVRTSSRYQATASSSRLSPMAIRTCSRICWARSSGNSRPSTSVWGSGVSEYRQGA